MAIQNQSPAAFEIMMEMLNGFPDLCLSKMMLSAMMLILDHDSPKVMDFLENAMFVPQ